ncbi:glucosyltransferase domain-containing protein [Archangium lipolyticum]|uniref:glucosyltransferase domain-containing protein n=1 Tax=Archangium lipolyticum TaxID=2970465 RepID=UPI00214A1A5E|nr:glucosyltransferase domain-containing protein [Archangium lipolyticum]
MKPLIAETQGEPPALSTDSMNTPVHTPGVLTRRELTILGGVFVLLLMTWFPKLSPTFFSTDDYFLIHNQDPREVTDLMLGQGRFGYAVLFTVMNALGAPHAKTVTLYSWLAIALLAFASVLLARIWRITHERWLPFVVGPLIFTHPYFAELWTFRGVPAYFCVSLIPSLLAVEWTRTRGWHGLSVAVPLLVFSLSIYQLNFNPLVATIFIGLALDLARTTGEKGTTSRTVRAWLPVLSLVPLACVTYMVVNRVIQKALSVPPLERAQLLPLADIPQRWAELKWLYSQTLLRDQVLSTPLLTRLELGVLGVALVLVGLRAWRHRAPGKGMMMWLLSGASLACIAGIVMALKVWGTAPRILITLAFVIGGHLALAYVLMSARFRGVLLGAAGLLLVGFTGLDQQVSAGQLRVNQIDRETASRVLQRMEKIPGTQELRNIIFVNHPTSYPGVLSIGDTNSSALALPWSQAGLMSEISGRSFVHVNDANRARLSQHCTSTPRWPDEQSVRVEGDTVVVCF